MSNNTQSDAIISVIYYYIYYYLMTHTAWQLSVCMHLYMF